MNFRRKNYFLQNSKDQLDLFTEEDRLEQEYADVIKDPLLVRISGSGSCSLPYHSANQ